MRPRRRLGHRRWASWPPLATGLGPQGSLPSLCPPTGCGQRDLFPRQAGQLAGGAPRNSGRCRGSDICSCWCTSMERQEAGLPSLVHSPNAPGGQARLGLKPDSIQVSHVSGRGPSTRAIAGPPRSALAGDWERSQDSNPGTDACCWRPDCGDSVCRGKWRGLIWTKTAQPTAQ